MGEGEGRASLLLMVGLDGGMLAGMVVWLAKIPYIDFEYVLFDGIGV